MVKLIVAVRFVEDGRTKEELYRYWEHEHASLAVKTPGQVRYVQNHVTGPRLVENLELDGIAELWFSDESFEAALESTEWKAALDDAATFVDFSRSLATVVRELPLG